MTLGERIHTVVGNLRALIFAFIIDYANEGGCNVAVLSRTFGQGQSRGVSSHLWGTCCVCSKGLERVRNLLQVVQSSKSILLFYFDIWYSGRTHSMLIFCYCSVITPSRCGEGLTEKIMQE